MPTSIDSAAKLEPLGYVGGVCQPVQMLAPAEDRMPEVDLLLGFILRYVQLPSRRSQFLAGPGRSEDFLLLFGLTHRVRRLAQSYLRLRHAGFEVEGEILIRSALEHAMTAQWAYLAVDGLARLRVSATKDQLSLVKVIAEYSSDPEMPRTVHEFAGRVEPGAALPNITEMIKQLDNNGFLRSTYKVLSQVTHVTHQATLDALDSDEDGNVTLRLTPASSFGHQNLYVLASACMLSSWVIAHIANDEAELTRLLEDGRVLSLPCRLDASLPQAARRFDDDVSYDEL